MTKYITTPIYYVNGDPHIGHAYTTILGDILKKAMIMRGENVFYTTGTDEHGQKNQQACENSPLGTEEYLKSKSDNFRNLFDKLNIDYDFFVRTSSEKHKKLVEKCLNIIHEKGLVIKKSYKGLYCEGCEQFKKESDLDANGYCPDHNVKPQEVLEENYFFRLDPYREWLISHIKENPEWIQPSFYATEILNMLKEPIEDLCISRPKNRVSLGIELPFDKEYVTYIWFDALTNYISSINWQESEDFDKYWNNSIHLMAKDIIKPHCIYWPIMLKALGLKPVNKVMVHGYWIGEGGVKMSKSIGNVVDPNDVMDIVGIDALRFYLVNAMQNSRDSQISDNLIKDLYKVLANTIGNLHMRSCKMLQKYNDGIIPEVTLSSDEKKLIEEISKDLTSSLKSIDNIGAIHKLSDDILKTASKINAYVDSIKPWSLAKDDSKKSELNSCLYVLLEAIRLIGTAIYPICPIISNNILKVFNINSDHLKLEDLKPYRLEVKTKINELEMLFPKLED